MSGITVVKRYARALFETGKEAGVLDEIRKDMEFLEGLLNDAPEIRRFCLESHSNRKKEFIFVQNAFLPYVSQYTARMLEAACENDRLSAVPYIPEAYREQEERDMGIVSLDIETVDELSEENLRMIEDKMSDRINKKVQSRVRLNPALIGGIRVSWENRTIDLSLRGRLNKMKSLLSGNRK